MTSTNRALNRLLVIVVGLVLIAAGVALGGAFSRRVIAASYPQAGNGRFSYLELNWRR